MSEEKRVKFGGVTKIDTTHKSRDKTGLLGKAKLVTDVVTEVYRVKDNSVFSFITLHLCSNNPTGTSTNLIIWVSSEKYPIDVKDIDLVEPSLTILGGAVFVRGGLTLSPGEAVFIKSSTDNIVIRVDGSENNPL